MIKHIVLFKVKETLPVEEMNEKLTEIKSDLEALMGTVDSLRFIETGINCNPKETYHLSLLAEFDDMDGLEAYATHPAHVAVGVKVRAILDQRACVDYLF